MGFMKKYFSLSACLVTVSAGVMLALFFHQAALHFSPGQSPMFSFTERIAYGYGEVCGDGEKEVSEGCDDGDTSSGDGCSASCTVESGYSCTGTTPSVCVEVCGNAVKTTSEGCDDGDTTSGDGCSASCAVETGYSCTGTAPSSCETTCGDGVKAGAEACDDGDTSSSDGCSASCEVESGYSCAGTAPSVCQTGCGDDIVAGTEECDPGAEGETALCNNDCTNVSCGDSKINASAGETCDAGSSNSTTGACSPSCLKTYCGDGILQSPNGNGQSELCEPTLSATCQNSCTFGQGIGTTNYTPVAASSSSASARLAPPATCGNGVLDLSKGEECDQGRFNGLSPLCDRWCRSQFCGDNVVQKQNGEECEPARADDGTYTVLQCGQTCTVPTCNANGFCGGGCKWLFLPACTQPVPPAPVLETSSSASSVSSFNDVQNTIATGIEDVTGPLSGDMQSSSAISIQPLIIPVPSSSSTASSFSSASSSSVPLVSEPAAFCGDGILNNDEECDRGMSDNELGNGCTPTCKVSICGNMSLEPGEECDDGKRNSRSQPDSCSTLCLLPRCGDGIVDPAFGELCDTGTNNSAYTPGACRLNCVPAYCGDFIKDPLEQCDNGPDGSAFCTPFCTLTAEAASADGLHSAAPSGDNSTPLLVFLLMQLLIFVYKLDRMLRRRYHR